MSTRNYCLLILSFIANEICGLSIFKAYEVQFNLVRNQDYCSTYTRPNFLPNSMMCRHQSGRPSSQRIRNKMDDSIPNKKNMFIL